MCNKLAFLVVALSSNLSVPGPGSVTECCICWSLVMLRPGSTSSESLDVKYRFNFSNSKKSKRKL